MINSKDYENKGFKGKSSNKKKKKSDMTQNLTSWEKYRLRFPLEDKRSDSPEES